MQTNQKPSNKMTRITKAISFIILTISLNTTYSQLYIPIFTNSLHVVVNNDSLKHPILIEKEKQTGQPQFKLLQLDNTGLLYAREIKINLQSWPDYVFHKEYELMPLSEVETYIAKNGHLPNIPKAETIETEGLNLGEMNKLLMLKVEELTLYLIEQQKVIDSQQKRLEVLETKYQQTK